MEDDAGGDERGDHGPGWRDAMLDQCQLKVGSLREPGESRLCSCTVLLSVLRPGPNRQFDMLMQGKAQV